MRKRGFNGEIIQVKEEGLDKIRKMKVQKSLHRTQDNIYKIRYRGIRRNPTNQIGGKISEIIGKRVLLFPGGGCSAV